MKPFALLLVIVACGQPPSSNEPTADDKPRLVSIETSPNPTPTPTQVPKTAETTVTSAPTVTPVPTRKPLIITSANWLDPVDQVYWLAAGIGDYGLASKTCSGEYWRMPTYAEVALAIARGYPKTSEQRATWTSTRGAADDEVIAASPNSATGATDPVSNPTKNSPGNYWIRCIAKS